MWTVAAHDTASAFVAAPLRGPREAVLSSGTWSLLGLEVSAPFLGADAAALNLTNERGLDGTIRLLRNVMGLWLLQECRRCWQLAGGPSGYDELHALAASARPDVALFDPDDGALLTPGDMPAEIARLCQAGGQPPPASRGETVRSILVSLACKYRLVLEGLALVTRSTVDVAACRRRRRAQRAAVPADRRSHRVAGVRRPGGGDRARQRAGPGARRRRARRLARRPARGRGRLRTDRPATSPPTSSAPARPTRGSSR